MSMRQCALVSRVCRISAVVIVMTILIGWRHPRSPLNVFATRDAHRVHDHVVAVSSAFMTTFQPSSVSFGTETDPPDFTFVVMTTKRPVTYLNVFFWSLITGSTAGDLKSVRVALINTNEPSQVDPGLDRFRDVPGVTVRDVHGGQSGQRKSETTRDLEKTIASLRSGKSQTRKKVKEWFRDQYVGYVEALLACLDSKAPWCIICEEDAMLSRAFLVRLRALLEQRPEPRRKHLMLKAYVGDFLTGFEYSFRTLFELILLPAIVSLCIAVLAMNPQLCRRARFMTMGRTRDYEPLLVVTGTFKTGAILACVVFGTTITVMMILGRQQVVEMFERRDPHLGPCTEAAGNVANVFTRSSAIALKLHLEQRLYKAVDQLKPIDLDMFEWMQDSGDWDLLEVTPSIVQHMGAMSSNPSCKTPKYTDNDSRFTLDT
ncbi:Uncharacterized protein PBTT_08868 [Plasmodiophora brassicae]